MSPQISSQVTVESGAAAVGKDSVAVGQRGVHIGGDARGPIFTGDLRLDMGSLAVGESSQAINDVFQAMLQNALLAVNRPHVEELFRIIRDPAALAEVDWEPAPGATVTLFDLPYQAGGRENGLDTRQALKNEPGSNHLLIGRSGLGKTREAAELARLLCQEGWTVCLARVDTCRKMGETAGTLPDKKVLLVVDDLHRHAALGTAGPSSYLDRLHQFLSLLEQDPALQLRLLATIPDPNQAAINAHPLGQRFQHIWLAEFKPATLQEILKRAADRAGVAVAEEQLAAMVDDSDGTPKAVVAKVNLAWRDKADLTLERWRDTAAGVWTERVVAVRQKEPLADAVYQAVLLLHAAGLPPRPDYITGLGDGDGGPAIQALVNQGLLRRQYGALYPFTPDQLANSLEQTGQPLLELADNWPRIVQVLLAAAPQQSEGAADLVALADGLNDAGRHNQAEEVATAALAQDDGLSDAYLQRGRARIHQEQYAAAEADYTAVITGGREDPHLFLARGLCRLAQMKVAAAEADLDRAEETGDPLVYQARGLAHLPQGKYVEAVADFSRCLEAWPEANDVRLLRGFAHFMLGHFAEAVNDFDRLLAQAETHPSVFLMRGWIAYLQQDWQAAESDFVAARDQGLSQAFLHLLLAEIHMKQEKYEAVIADTSAAIAQWANDDYVTVLTHIAQALPENIPDLAAAIAALLKQNPDWLRQLILATSGVELKTKAEIETLADYWGQLMGDVEATRIDFHALRYLPATPYLTRGLARVELGDYAAAEQDFSDGLEQGLEPAIGHYNRGLARFWQGHGAAAENDFTIALSHQPEDGATLVYRGLARYQTKEYTDAEADLSQAIQLGVDNGEVYATRGWLRVLRADFAGALADFDRALERDPQNGRTYYGRGYASLNLGNSAAAEADFTVAVSHGFTEPSVFLERAAVRLDSGQAAGAEQDATLVLNHVGDYAPAYMLRGAARSMSGDYLAAKADLDAALAGGVDSDYLFYNRATTHYHLGLLAAAEEDYTAALDRGWPAYFIFAERGLTRFLLGRYKEAVSDLDQAVQLDSSNNLPYLCRGLTYIALENYAAAVEDYSAVLVQNPKETEAYQRRALAYVRLNRLAEAESDCKQAEEIAPETLLTHLAWAELYRGQTEYQAAVNAGREALVMAPVAESYFSLGLSLLLAGDIEAALVAYGEGLPLAQLSDLHLARQALDYWQEQRPERLDMPPAEERVQLILSQLVGD